MCWSYPPSLFPSSLPGSKESPQPHPRVGSRFSGPSQLQSWLLPPEPQSSRGVGSETRVAHPSPRSTGLPEDLGALPSSPQFPCMGSAASAVAWLRPRAAAEAQIPPQGQQGAPRAWPSPWVLGLALRACDARCASGRRRSPRVTQW